ncbi:hypothetical protein BN8_02291 [Fibrisoma limi BUZ 3]|uniref:Uncharacterized protein n=1 Tax=Fibrisoma limi BUZ 3 TaxID=1185876 RepID=I2GH39_9BACT|nr:hypothetical protein BN8_02291 [Fibrisoma limi BUZ 3]
MKRYQCYSELKLYKIRILTAFIASATSTNVAAVYKNE